MHVAKHLNIILYILSMHNFYYSLFVCLCVCESVHTQACVYVLCAQISTFGDQSAACWGWVSPSTVWVLRIELGWLG